MDNQVKDAFVRIKSCTFAFMKRTFLIFLILICCCFSVQGQQKTVQKPRLKVGLVLGGGGAKGLPQ